MFHCRLVLKLYETYFILFSNNNPIEFAVANDKKIRIVLKVANAVIPRRMIGYCVQYDNLFAILKFFRNKFFIPLCTRKQDEAEKDDGVDWFLRQIHNCND